MARKLNKKVAKRLNITLQEKAKKPTDQENAEKKVDKNLHFSRTASQSSINKSEASRTKSSNIKY